jgi:hypothetical protein
LVVTVEGTSGAKKKAATKTIATPMTIFVVRLMSEATSFGWIYAYM